MEHWPDDDDDDGYWWHSGLLGESSIPIPDAILTAFADERQTIELARQDYKRRVLHLRLMRAWHWMHRFN